MTESDNPNLAFEIASLDSVLHNPILQGPFKEKFLFHLNTDAMRSRNQNHSTTRPVAWTRRKQMYDHNAESH